MKTTLEKLGIMASYSRPRVSNDSNDSNDNPFSEALFRTCKYRPDWPNKGFATKVDAQAWVKSFVNWYNDEHLHSAIRFVTPNMRRGGSDRDALANRAILYANARAKTGTMVRRNAQLAARRSRLAEPGTRNQRARNQRRRMKSADNSFDKHRSLRTDLAIKKA